MLKSKSSPIYSEGLEVLLLLRFESKDEWLTDIMKEFVGNFYSFDFAEGFSCIR